MTKVGIDTAAFYTSPYYLDLKTLAEARQVPCEKFYEGLGQHKMAVMPPDENIVTLAANAARVALQSVDRNEIDLLLFSTESGIDYSKSAGIYVHRLLQLPKEARVLELKQACYAGTAGLRLAMSMLQTGAAKKVLWIASDIARYGLNTSGESSQGGGAVAMVLSTNPRLIAIEDECGFHSEDVMDFWRPNYRNEALVEGKYSCELYLRLLKECYQRYSQKSGRNYEDHAQFCYHVPMPRLAEKAHQKLRLIATQTKLSEAEAQEQLSANLIYNRLIGNCYTAALFLSCISLLDNNPDDLSNQRIGFYSYGSGCTAEFFSGVIQPGYQNQLHRDYHHELLESRSELTQAQYEAFYSFHYPTDGSQLRIETHSRGPYRLAEIDKHQNIYECLD
jgi:hydroxymethylglutaryl-CoA synthase